MTDALTCEEVSWNADPEYFYITFMYNGKRFVVGLFRQPIPGYDETNTIEVQCMDKLLVTNEDSDKNVEVMSQISRSIEGLLLPFMQLHVPPRENQTYSLHTWLNLEILSLQVATMNGEVMIVRRAEAFEPEPIQKLDIAGMKSALPIVSATDIELLQVIFPIRAFKVLVDGQERFCKLGGTHYRNSMQTEFETLHQILSANIPQIQVPGLKGLVRSEDRGFLGILTEYIQTAKPPLDRIDLQSIPKPLKMK